MKLDRSATVLHMDGPAERVVRMPVGHRGLYILPTSGRTVWWTGRVAIGLRHGLRDGHVPVERVACAEAASSLPSSCRP